jgi:hypothetical protein
MKFFFAAVLAAACVIGSSPALARAGHGAAAIRSAGHGNLNPTTQLPRLPQQAPMENRIPAPLAPPSQAPAINGPPLRSPYGGVMH